MPLAVAPVRSDAVGEDMHPAAAARGQERSSRVRDLFGAIAPRYELVNRLASAGRDAAWRRRVVAELELRAGESCLDACCGTGDLSRALAATGVNVVGIDFCRAMLAMGASRAARTSIVMAEGDASCLPIRSASMDAACVAFGLRNLADPARGLAELARVVRPGGRVAVLEFSQPRGRMLRWIYGAYTGRVLPLLGDAVSGSWGTYRYLPETIRSWFTPEQLADIMQQAGFRDVRVLSMTLGIVSLHVGVVATLREEGS